MQQLDTNTYFRHEMLHLHQGKKKTKRLNKTVKTKYFVKSNRKINRWLSNFFEGPATLLFLADYFHRGLSLYLPDHKLTVISIREVQEEPVEVVQVDGSYHLLLDRTLFYGNKDATIPL